METLKKLILNHKILFTFCLIVLACSPDQRTGIEYFKLEFVEAINQFRKDEGRYPENKTEFEEKMFLKYQYDILELKSLPYQFEYVKGEGVTVFIPKEKINGLKKQLQSLVQENGVIIKVYEKDFLMNLSISKVTADGKIYELSIIKRKEILSELVNPVLMKYYMKKEYFKEGESIAVLPNTVQKKTYLSCWYTLDGKIELSKSLSEETEWDEYFYDFIPFFKEEWSHPKNIEMIKKYITIEEKLLFRVKLLKKGEFDVLSNDSP